MGNAILRYAGPGEQPLKCFELHKPYPINNKTPEACHLTTENQLILDFESFFQTHCQLIICFGNLIFIQIKLKIAWGI